MKKETVLIRVDKTFKDKIQLLANEYNISQSEMLVKIFRTSEFSYNFEYKCESNINCHNLKKYAEILTAKNYHRFNGSVNNNKNKFLCSLLLKCYLQ